MDVLEDSPRTGVTPQGPRLATDLARLRERFLLDHPDQARRTTLLAQVPIALRHLLGLQLELARADTLPERYRQIVQFTPTTQESAAWDEVDRLVQAYAAAVRTPPAGGTRDRIAQLRRYFTESQIVELTLAIALAQAFAAFDTALGIPPQNPGPQLPTAAPPQPPSPTP